MEAKQFIDKLSGSDPIAALENFLGEFESQNDSKDFIIDLLKESPNFEVILKLLDVGKWTKVERTTILDILGSFLMRVPADREFESVSLHVTQFILKYHSKTLMNLLTPLNANRSLIAALKVITGMIVSSVAAATEVVTQFGFDRIEFVALAKEEEVRRHLFYMVLAILNNGDGECLRHFLGNADRITCLFEGLVEDPSEIIIRFLNYLRDIVLNITISKTIKTKIFNFKTCKFLTALYFNQKRQYEPSFSPEERTGIKKSLHSLMLPLCSDLKFGVIFKEKENKVSNRQSNNLHVYEILCTIKYPWQFEEGRELISSILKSCPDITELYKKQVKHHFVPREYIGFITLSKLFIMLIDKREPWIDLEERLQKGGSIKDFSFSIPFGLWRTVMETLDNSSVVVRHFGLLILISYFKKAIEFISKLEEKTYLSDEYRKEFKDKIMSDIVKLNLTANKLKSLWHSYLAEEKVTVPSRYESECSSQFCTLVDICEILYIYSEIFGYKLVRRIFSPLNMLFKIDELTMSDDLAKSKLRVSILKLILQAQKLNEFEAFGFIRDKSENEEENNINENLFATLVDIYYANACTQSDDPSNAMRVELKNLSLVLLKSSLDCWGLSSYCKNHIEVWLDNIKTHDEKACAEFFAKVISKSVSNLFSYLDVMIAMNTEIEGNESSVPINVLDFVNQLDPSVQIEDNEDVNLSAIKIPFSCLILGALDILKADPNIKLINYFMAVVDDYIHRIDHPEMLSKHLLEYNILNIEMKEYLTFWSTRHLLSPPSITFESNSDQSSVASELKIIFMGGNTPSVSTFCNNLPNRYERKSEFEYICNQLYVYIQSEHKLFQKSKDKKKLKFFIKVFKKLLNITQKDPNVMEFLSLFEHLLNHAFTLQAYEPFNSSDVQNVIDSVLHIVIERYPDLHSDVKPFVEKFIVSLKSNSLDEEMLLKSTLTYLDSYNHLTFDEVEKIAFALLSMETGSHNFINLLSKLLKLLRTHSSPSHQPSKDLISFVITKMILMSKKKSLSEEELKVFHILSDFSQIFFLPNVVQNLKSDDFKNILRSRIANDTLVQILRHVDPSQLETLLKILNEIKVHLACQVPFIVSLIKGKQFENCPEISSYLLRIKGSLLDWALNPKSEMNNDYQEVIDHMLANNLFELQEIADVCTAFYKPENETPRHILTLVPFFKTLAMKNINNNNYSEHDPPHPYIQLLSILMRGIVKMYRRMEEEPTFSKEVGDVILNITTKIEPRLMRREFYVNKLWSSFVRKVLKEALTDCENGPKLLKCLTELAKLVYSKRKKEDSAVPPMVLYQMLRSHSQFIPVMLNYEATDVIKEQIVFLQLTLAELCSTICEERHIPLLLGAYGATASKCDQYILKILYLYEKRGCMPTVEPTVWGRAAVAHFAVAKGPDGDAEYIPPKVNQILSLIDCEMVIETSLHFDMKLGLEPTTIVEKSNPALYDQRFLLSIFLYFTSVANHLNVMNMAEKGIVAISVAALTSHCDEVWAAGAKLLQYVATSFESSKFYNLKLQWMWLIGVLGYGLEGKKQRIPSTISHFLIRASQLLLHPQDLMYKPVMNYLYLRPALQLFRVPELYVFFFSDDVRNNKEHRAFLFDLLSGGIRDDLDFQVCKASFVPKLILAVIKSPTVNTRLRVLALNVLNSMVKIPYGAYSLVLEQSLLEDLPLALNPNLLCPSHKQRFWIEAVIEILCSLWHTWKTSELDFEPFETNMDVKSGVKRKIEEISGNHINSDFTSRKKRKLSREQYSIDDRVQNKKKVEISDRAEGGLVEILRCLGCIFSQVISEGDVESISKMFYLLKELVTYFETLEKEDRYHKSPIISSKFAKHQVKLWMENSDFVKRFRESFDDEDALLHDWRYKPLMKGSIRVNEECSRIKTVIQERKELLKILNIIHIYRED